MCITIVHHQVIKLHYTRSTTAVFTHKIWPRNRFNHSCGSTSQWISFNSVENLDQIKNKRLAKWINLRMTQSSKKEFQLVLCRVKQLSYFACPCKGHCLLVLISWFGCKNAENVTCPARKTTFPRPPNVTFSSTAMIYGKYPVNDHKK